MDKENNTIQNDRGYDLVISIDKMQAFVRPFESPPPDTDPDSIKGILESEGISFGVADDATIAEYMACNPSTKKSWKIAQGKSVNPGKPPEIKYHFDTNPLRAGTVDESGAIDFKNRGEIPQVKEGEIIAEIISGIEGQPGKDIYGNTIAPPEYSDITISCGKGAKKSEEDPLKFVAQTKGRPEVLGDGTLCVSNVMIIPGDLGIETGHVEFDGHIEVQGSILEGYRVNGQTLKADEILQADLEIEGDIVVSKGIIGANIRTDGTIRARHIRDAVIDSLGDIHVEAEVYESRIETNGIFNMERGKILSSTVSAMRGINTTEIGSESSVPCELVVGVDNRLEKKIANMNLTIAEMEKEKGIQNSQLDELRNAGGSLEALIGEQAQQEDSLNVKDRSLKATLEKLKAANDHDNIAKVQKIIKHLDLELGNVKKNLGKLMVKLEKIENKVRDCNTQIENSENVILELQDDINSLTELVKMKKYSATVKASGTVTENTSIRGPHASFVAKQNLQRVSIQEVKNAEPDAETQWVMIVSPL